MGAGTMRVELDAIPGLSVGDRVEVDVHISQMKAALTLFALPLAAVLLGVLLGNWLSGNYFPDTRFPGLPAILLALVFVSLTYLGVYLYERKAAKTRKPPTIRKADSGPSGSPEREKGSGTFCL